MAKFSLNDILNSQSKTTESQSNQFEVRHIPLDQIVPSTKNAYGIRDIEELGASIEMVGLQHNLVVKPNGNGLYELISGERRYHALKLIGWATAPCKIERQPDNLMDELRLIMANSTARELTDYEKTYQVARLKELFQELKVAGYKIPGRLRECVADILKVSPAQVGIMEHINKNLVSEFKEEFKKGNIGISTANELAKMPKEKQEEAIESFKSVGVKVVKPVKRSFSSPNEDHMGLLMEALNGVELSDDEMKVLEWLAGLETEFVRCFVGLIKKARRDE
ncbi:MAG: ParB/RepB/Spo0J family partition protein [Clostridia bacterium]|nr:ParB/RepB/Spo0J family partition protein [Clostridia bacterium]